MKTYLRTFAFSLLLTIGFSFFMFHVSEVSAGLDGMMYDDRILRTIVFSVLGIPMMAIAAVGLSGSTRKVKPFNEGKE